jgi:hypothetical protein
MKCSFQCLGVASDRNQTQTTYKKGICGQVSGKVKSIQLCVQVNSGAQTIEFLNSLLWKLASLLGKVLFKDDLQLPHTGDPDRINNFVAFIITNEDTPWDLEHSFIFNPSLDVIVGLIFNFGPEFRVNHIQTTWAMSAWVNKNHQHSGVRKKMSGCW